VVFPQKRHELAKGSCRRIAHANLPSGIKCIIRGLILAEILHSLVTGVARIHVSGNYVTRPLGIVAAEIPFRCITFTEPPPLRKGIDL
jgi:hypothetical protein